MSKNDTSITIFWLRRDLRWRDNRGLLKALEEQAPVQPLFIFDEDILQELPQDDARLTFIHDTLKSMNKELEGYGGSILCRHGKPVAVWKQLLEDYTIQTVYTNKDYEPYARKRDKAVHDLLEAEGIVLHRIKDQVIFEEREVMKKDGKPYSVYTPYKRTWLKHFNPTEHQPVNEVPWKRFASLQHDFPSLKQLGFVRAKQEVKPYDIKHLADYETERNFPGREGTSNLSPHLRFGTISPRQIIAQLDLEEDAQFLSELIWREFFMQILYHFPQVVQQSFRPRYDHIQWRNNEAEFDLWCQGKTGYPMVDAGIRELNATGYMHNRVRMVVASFLCKHLLIDWRWGEAYFAQKLLDYELSSNNGNWQWAAGSGCDASPYFRVFNPITQLSKFDPQGVYTNRWIPELGTDAYPAPMVDHKEARERALHVYKATLKPA